MSHDNLNDDGLADALKRQWNNAPSYVGSVLFHGVVFILFLILTPLPKPINSSSIYVTTELIGPQEFEDPIEQPVNIKTGMDTDDTENLSLNNLGNFTMDAPVISQNLAFDIQDEPTNEPRQDNSDFATDFGKGADAIPVSSIMEMKNKGDFGGFSSRNRREKKKMLKQYGGDKSSEAALERGLRWLARHQDTDGSWKLFYNPKYFSGRFGFIKEPHLKEQNDSSGKRNEWCMSSVTVPYDMTLALELDHVDDYASVFINGRKHGPYPNSNSGENQSWKGTFEVKKGDKFRVKVTSSSVGKIWCIGRYHDAKFPAPVPMRRAPYFRTEAGLTALCTLAFLGAGNTAKIGRYKNYVRKAQHFLLNVTYEEFGTALPAPIAYEAPIMIMALSELYGMDADPKIKVKVQRLIDMGVKYQLKNGGWPENVANDKQGSWHNTTWWLCALKSARIAGLNVPDRVFDKGLASIMECVTFEGESNRYANIQGKPGYPRAEGAPISKMVSSMAVYLMNSIKGVGLEDEKIRAMCELMVLAGTNRNGVWDWPGGNLGLTYKGKVKFLPEFFEADDAEKKNDGGKYQSYFMRSIKGFPTGKWGKPEYMESFDQLVSGAGLKTRFNWYSATYWFWQGNSFSRLGRDTPYWQGWNNNFKPYLIYTQAKNGKWPSLLTVDNKIAARLETGDIDGSWPGVFLANGCGPFEDMGQAGATAFCCMMLEVYYNYN